MLLTYRQAAARASVADRRSAEPQPATQKTEEVPLDQDRETEQAWQAEGLDQDRETEQAWQAEGLTSCEAMAERTKCV